MLNNAKILKNYKLNSLDGEIGEVKDFYFDDKYWEIRYLVADTGHWLTAGQLLISPYAQITMSKDKQNMTIDLTNRQIEDSPALNTSNPLPRQFGHVYYGYYGWPMYQGGSFMWGPHPYAVRDLEQWKDTTRDEKASKLQLRSAHALRGYNIQAVDHEIGYIEDFIIDDETWMIRYLIIDTQKLNPGKKVLVSPRWIDRVNWDEAKAFVGIPSENIRKSPEYTDSFILTRDYESALHRHYNRQEYWVDETSVEEYYK